MSSKRKGIAVENSFDLTADELTTLKMEPLEIPERQKNGKPGIVFVRELPAPDVIAYITNRGDTTAEDKTWLFSVMSIAICKRDGSPMFAPDGLKNLRETSFAIFTRLQTKFLELNPINSGGENPLEETISSESPTN